MAQLALRGTLSEQTLRHQLGMQAERFGHSSSAPANTAASVKEGLRVATEMASRRAQIEQAVEQRGFVARGLSDKVKLAALDREAASQNQVKAEGRMPDVVTCSDGSKLCFDVSPGFTAPA